MPITTLLALAASVASQPTPAELAWVQKEAIPITTVEAGNGFKDLEPLRDIFAHARVVGLGESTHGTREHFQMKHRLVEFLASELGYTVFSIEASTPESFRVDEYVSRGEGDPAGLIGGMYFWTWNTEEVLSMVTWMQGFNVQEQKAGSGKSIRFTGFDMQEPRVARKIVRDFVSAADPDYLPELDEHWRVLETAGPAASGFGTATGTFPVDKARGKKISLHGFIRTEKVDGGFAGLWLRVDGKDHAMLAFDNMQNRGASGTTGWKEYSLTLAVPEHATNINFGCLLSGPGQAWFDSLAVELDGKAYEDAAFDFAFEDSAIKGLSAFSPGYDISLSKDKPYEGQGALCLRSAEQPHAASMNAVPDAREVLEHLQAARDRYLDADLPTRKVDWVIHNAEVIHQWARMTCEPGSTTIRDESMAANVLWLLKQDPDAKVVLWAHNMHMSTAVGFQGSHLRRALGDEYVAVGFAAGHGQYYAMPGATKTGVIHDLTDPPPDSIETLFEKAGHPIAAINLRNAREGTDGAQWIFEPRKIRTIGALAMDEQFGEYSMRNTFDVLIYTKNTSAARQLKSRAAGMDR